MIKICNDRSVFPNNIKVSNQYENDTRSIDFDLSDVQFTGNTYLICKYQGQSTFYAPLLLDSNFSIPVETFLSAQAGAYTCIIVISTVTIDENYDFSSDNPLFVSNEFTLNVEQNFLTGTATAWQLTPAAQNYFDQLIALVEKVQEDLNSGAFNGNGIQSITKTGSEGLVDTYQILFTNGSTFDFQVTNGATPTITIQDGVWFVNGVSTGVSAIGQKGDKGDPGVGIVSIEKTSTSGNVDTYTITFTNQTTSTFTVTNGTDGVTPNIQIGTVTTLEPGQQATATITGTPENPLLNLGIPQGQKGEGASDNFIYNDVAKQLNPNVTDSFQRAMWNLMLYGQSTQGADPSPTSPQEITAISQFDGAPTGGNLFNINGNVNINGNTGLEENYNSVENNILTTNAQENAYGIGQKFSNLAGKTVSFSAKLVSLGTATSAWMYIYDGGLLAKRRISSSTVGNIMVMNNYVCVTDFVVCAFACSKDGTGCQFTDIQLELGTTATAYEPYTGGQPSPSPEYPQEITAISEFKGNVTGLNIFPNDVSYSKEYQGLTINVNNGDIEITGDSVGYCDFDYITGEYIGALNNQAINDFYQDKHYIYNYTGKIMANANVISTAGNGQNTPHVYVYIIDEDYTQTNVILIANNNTVYFPPNVAVKKSIRGIMIRKWYAGDCNVKISDITVALQSSKPNIAQYQGNKQFTYTPSQAMYSTQDGRICDYVDVEKGVEVYYSNVIESYNGEEVGDNWISTTGELSNGATVVYFSDTPTEIPIDPIQLAILRALYTYTGVTNFLCNAPVSFSYERSLQIVINNLENAIGQTNANILLGGNQ